MAFPLLAALSGGALVGTVLKIAITYVVWRLIKLLGIVFISYYAITTTFEYLTDQVEGHMNNIPSAILGIVQICGVDTAVGMYISTVLGLAAFKSLTSGVSIARASIFGNMS